MDQLYAEILLINGGDPATVRQRVTKEMILPGETESLMGAIPLEDYGCENPLGEPEVWRW